MTAKTSATRNGAPLTFEPTPHRPTVFDENGVQVVHFFEEDGWQEWFLVCEEVEREVRLWTGYAPTEPAPLLSEVAG